jgi:osmotically-inducible protein OsmY
VLVDPASLVVTYTLARSTRRHPLHVDAARAVGDEQLPVPAGLVRIAGVVRVRLGDATVGRASTLWVDRQTSALTHALVRPRNGLFSNSPERILPIDLVEAVTERGLVLSKGAPALGELPLYRSDAAVERDVRLALALAVPDIQARRSIKVRVEDGQVSLAGAVETAEVIEAAQRAVEQVPGVRGLVLDLISQEALGERVEQRIAQMIAEQSIVGADVRVLTEHAIVYLEGTAPSMEARAQIESAALEAAGTRVVVNDIAVGGQTPSRATETGPLVRNR